MNQLDERQLGLHVPIVGWIYIISSALFVLTGGFIFVLLTSIGILADERQAFAVLTIVGLGVGGLLVLSGLPGLVAGIGLLARKPWARILALIVAALNLLNFPIGTMLGLYAGWVLLQDKAADYFVGHISVGQPVANAVP